MRPIIIGFTMLCKMRPKRIHKILAGPNKDGLSNVIVNRAKAAATAHIRGPLSPNSQGQAPIRKNTKKNSNPKCYFIGTKHDDFLDFPYTEGSTIIDPWRYIQSKNDCKVISIGVGEGYDL